MFLALATAPVLGEALGTAYFDFMDAPRVAAMAAIDKAHEANQRAIDEAHRAEMARIDRLSELARENTARWQQRHVESAVQAMRETGRKLLDGQREKLRDVRGLLAERLLRWQEFELRAALVLRSERANEIIGEHGREVMRLYGDLTRRLGSIEQSHAELESLCSDDCPLADQPELRLSAFKRWCDRDREATEDVKAEAVKLDAYMSAVFAAVQRGLEPLPR